jgi:hypothetical protein
VVAGKNDKFDEARQNIVAPIGATSYQVNHRLLKRCRRETTRRSTKRCCNSPA